MTTELREAGRALDSEIATRVMGWTEVGEKQMYSLSDGDDDEPMHLVADGTELRGKSPTTTRGMAVDLEWRVPDFSTSIAAAWTVVEKMRADGWAVTIKDFGAWHVYMSKYVAAERDLIEADCDGVRDESLPLAICLAALKALAASTPQSAVDETLTAVSSPESQR